MFLYNTIVVYATLFTTSIHKKKTFLVWQLLSIQQINQIKN